MNNIDLYLQPYAEDDELLNTWVDTIIHRVSWRLVENQEDWLYMAGEAPDTDLPKLKPEAREYIRKMTHVELGWLVSYIVDYLITKYRLSNIELDEETIADLKWDLEDCNGGYEEWENEARKRIFQEYSEFLGEEKAQELAEGWWGDWRCSD